VVADRGGDGLRRGQRGEVGLYGGPGEQRICVVEARGRDGDRAGVGQRVVVELAVVSEGVGDLRGRKEDKDGERV